MKFTQRALTRSIVVLATVTASTWVQAYYVAPFVFIGPGQIIDGFEQNGAKAKAVNFGSAYQSEVSLSAGTIKNFVQVTGPSQYGSASGSFGDRLTFSNAQGTALNFSIAVDGNFSGPAPVVDRLDRIYRSTLYVFKASAGATIENFRTLEGALIAQDNLVFLPSPTESFNLNISESLSGSFLAESDRVVVDVFAFTQVILNQNSNPGTFTADFSHTSTFDIQTDPDVTYTSESGVFLGSGLTPAVPEPSTYALLMAGLVVVGLSARRGARSSR